MRIAVQAPAFVFAEQTRNFNGYNFQFLKAYKPLIYLSRPWHYFRYRKAFVQQGLDPGEYHFILQERSLRAQADVLVCFNGMAHVAENMPPRGFDGLKIWHVMDYSFFAARHNAALAAGRVDYVMAYGALDRHCGFFQEFYPGYIGRVMEVPFGYAPRFQCRTPAAGRKRKCIALGAINPITTDVPADDKLRDWYAHFAGHSAWSHTLRRFVVENEAALAPVVESMLPHFPARDNPDYDAPTVLNEYAMFLNDESIANFPPARTYEGVAAGSIMVARDCPIFTDAGFVDRENCILLPEISVPALRDILGRVLADHHLLDSLQQNGLQFIRRYSHENVAATLFQRLKDVYDAQNH
jgi:hypothetical protein